MVEVDFLTMMGQRDGYLDIDGVCHKRLHEPDTKPRPSIPERAEILSDTLGFGQHQLAEMEADRKRNNFNGVEFVRDKAVPEFIQVKIDSQKEWKKYVAHRGLHDRNGRNGGGGAVGVAQMEASKRLVARIKTGAELCPRIKRKKTKLS